MTRRHGDHGRAPSQRQLRVGETIRHALADILARGELHDPALADINWTVSEVRLSPDLRNATVFVSPLGGSADPDGLLQALRHAAPFLRARLGEAVVLKYLPRLTFEIDRTFDEADRIEHLLRTDPVIRHDVDAPRDEEDGA